MTHKISLTGHLTSSTRTWLLIERKKGKTRREGLKIYLSHKLNPDKSMTKLFIVGVGRFLC
jgi:hypothetical protein